MNINQLVKDQLCEAEQPVNANAADIAAGLAQRFARKPKQPIPIPKPVLKPYDDAAIAARNNRYHAQMSAEQNAGVARETAAKARAAASAEQNAGVARETAAKARAVTSAEQNAGVARETAAKARAAIPSAQQNAGVARETAAKARAAIPSAQQNQNIIPKPSVSQVATPNPMVTTPSGTVASSIPTVTDSVKGIVGNIGNIASKAHETVKTVVPGATPMQTAIGALGAGLVAKKFLSDRRR